MQSLGRGVVFVVVVISSTIFGAHADATAAHPTKSEKAYLKQLHQTVDTSMSDKTALHIGHAFCGLARRVGYADAMSSIVEEVSATEAAGFFLIGHVAIRTLCPDVGREVARSSS